MYFYSITSTVLLSLPIITLLASTVTCNERVISNMDDFNIFLTEMKSSDNSDYISLECDLNFTEMKGMMPLGVNENESKMHAFNGVFNGNGHWIHGLKIDTSEKACDLAGFFGVINGANVSDLKFDEHCEFVGKYAGSVAGLHYNNNCTMLKNIENFGRVEGEYSGGIVGLMDSVAYKRSVTYEGCSNHGNITATIISNEFLGTLSVGGIVGTINFGNDNNENSFVYMNNCSNNGTITINENSIPDTVSVLTYRCGGITGGHDYFENGDCSMSWCNNSGSVSITVDDNSTKRYLKIFKVAAGGLFGYSYGSSSRNDVNQCINTGTVTISSNIPEYKDIGFAGGIYGYIEMQSNLGRRCTNTINLGNVTCNCGTASGFDNTFYSAAREYSILNCMNGGNVKGNKAYGITSGDAINADNVVSMGIVNGIVSSNAMFNNAFSGSNSINSTLFVLNGVGPDEYNFKTFDIVPNETCVSGDNVKVCDILNGKRTEYSGFIWPEGLKRKGIIVQFCGSYVVTLDVLRGTQLSDILEEKNRAFLENGTELSGATTILNDMKLWVTPKPDETDAYVVEITWDVSVPDIFSALEAIQTTLGDEQDMKIDIRTSDEAKLVVLVYFDELEKCNALKTHIDRCISNQ